MPKAKSNHHHKETELLAGPVKMKPVVLTMVMALVAVVGALVVYKSRAAAGTLSLVPNTGSVALGSSLTLTIKANSGTDEVNAVEADLTYDQTKLQFVSIDTSGSAYGLQAVNSGGGGSVSIARANQVNLTGDQVVAVVTFTVIGSGSSNVNFAGTSALIRASDTANILSVKNNGTYTVSDTTAPSTPTGLGSPSHNETTINLAWTASTDNVGVTGYKIFRDGNQVGTSNTPSYSDTGLTVNTTYDYKVSAYDAAGNNSPQSSPFSQSTSTDIAAPSAPTGLSSPSKTTTSVSLSWSASTDNIGVAGYRIYANGTQAANSNNTSATVSNLQPSTGYSFTVAAFDAAGNVSPQSTPLPVTTMADSSAPTRPSGLSSPTQTTTSIDLNWSPSSDDVAVAGYYIYRNDSQIGTSPSSSFSDTGLTPDTIYNYKVVAYDGAGNNSSQSDPGSFRTLAEQTSSNNDNNNNDVSNNNSTTGKGSSSGSSSSGVGTKQTGGDTETPAVDNSTNTPTTTDGATTTRSISIKVEDANGNPVKDAKVVVDDKSTQTDATGVATFSAITPGAHSVTVSRGKDQITQTITVEASSDGAQTQNFDVALSSKSQSRNLKTTGLVILLVILLIGGATGGLMLLNKPKAHSVTSVNSGTVVYPKTGNQSDQSKLKDNEDS
jgi:chitodextrinase